MEKITAFLISCLLSVASLAQPLQEYQVKAVFLFNFTQFVTWPDSAFQNREAPLIVGVLGNDPFGSYLDEVITNEIVSGRPLIVKRYQQLGDVAGCHILFINFQESRERAKALATLRGRSILTVGDVSGFARQGGMIRFRNENNRIKLRVNLDRIREGNLVVSSKLLKLAEIVSSDD